METAVLFTAFTNQGSNWLLIYYRTKEGASYFGFGDWHKSKYENIRTANLKSVNCF